MTQNIAKGLVKHVVVLCIDKKDRALAIQQVLEKAGFKVIQSQGIYNTLRQIAQDMPHLLIADSILADGTVATLFDRLKQDPIANVTPILVLIQKNTREHLAPLAGRKFGGFLLGELSAKSLLAKVHEITANFEDVSPYFTPLESLHQNGDCNLNVLGTVVGVSNEQIVSRSFVQLDPSAVLICNPIPKNLGPVSIKMPSNVVVGNEIFNLFPKHLARGKGRTWVETLPPINLQGGGAAPARRRMIFYEPNVDRVKQFAQILSGYEIEVLPVDSLAQLATAITSHGPTVGCVYLHELPTTNTAWRDAWKKVPESSRPVLVIGTTSTNLRSTTDTRYLKKPFGLPLFLDTINGCFERGPEISKALTEGRDTAKIDVTFQAPARLVGIDETGGVIQLKFPLAAGCQFRIDHPMVNDIIGQEGSLTASASVRADDRPDVWFTKFEMIGAGVSKLKHYEKAKKIISSLNQQPKAS
jgi:CheY-like chemotaxis protein